MHCLYFYSLHLLHTWYPSTLCLRRLNLYERFDLCLVLFTTDIAFKVVKVDVTPAARAHIDKFNMGTLTSKLLDVPGLTDHRLCTVTSGASHNLK